MACSCRAGFGAERKLMSCGVAPRIFSVWRVQLLAIFVIHLPVTSSIDSDILEFFTFELY